MDKLVIGCGYLGQRVAALWRAQGHRVFATTRSAGRAAAMRAAGLAPILCDVLDRGSLQALPAVAYVDKVVVGPAARGAIDLDDSVADNLRRVAFSRDCRVDGTADYARGAELLGIQAARASGASGCRQQRSREPHRSFSRKDARRSRPQSRAAQ